MADFDFPNAQLPVPVPLQRSHEADDLEADLKHLFISLFNKHIATKAFDLNVSGMAHLGSFDQVRRIVNADGLALLPGGGNEFRTRYLHRAWTARNHRGRGLHFLQLYLQMLFPNVAKAEQLWMAIDGVYPDDCYSIIPAQQFIYPLIEEDTGLALDGSWEVGGMIDTSNQGEDGEWTYNTDGLILTNRVRITLDFSVDVTGVGNLLQIVRSVLPARFVPEFRYIISVEAPTPVLSYSHIDVHINRMALARPDLLMVTDDPDVWFELGDDDDADGAPCLMEDGAEFWHSE